jgi:hypothetical protein
MILRWCESPGNAARIAALSADQAPTAIIGCPHMESRHSLKPPECRQCATCGLPHCKNEMNGEAIVHDEDPT